MLENSHTIDMSIFFIWNLDVLMNLSRRQGRIQEFLERAPFPKGVATYYAANFSWKLYENEENFVDRRQRLVYVDPPLGANMEEIRQQSRSEKKCSSAIKAFFRWSFCKWKTNEQADPFPLQTLCYTTRQCQWVNNKKANNHVWFEAKTMNKLKHELWALCIWSGWWVEWCLVWCKRWCRTVL